MSVIFEKLWFIKKKVLKMQIVQHIKGVKIYTRLQH